MGLSHKSRAMAKYAPAKQITAEGARKCGRCGSTNLTARRAKGAKLGLGLLSLATPKTHLKCNQCGNDMAP